MTTRTLLTIALAGLFLPLSAEAQVSRLDKRYGIKRSTQAAPKPKAKPKANAKPKAKAKTAPKAKPTPKTTPQQVTPAATTPPKAVSGTVTPDLPANFTAASADTFPQECESVSLLRKFLHYTHAGDYETAKSLLEDQVKFNYGQMSCETGSPTMTDTMEENAASPDYVLSMIAEKGIFSMEYESLQLSEVNNTNGCLLHAVMQFNGQPEFVVISVGLRHGTGKILGINILAYPSTDKIPFTAKNVVMSADTLIEMGAKELSGIAPLKSRSAAESGGWGAPDMEFTADPKVRAAILGPQISPFQAMGMSMIPSNYVFQFRDNHNMKAEMLQHSPFARKFAPRVYLIGQNKDISREELFAMLCSKELELGENAEVIASGYKGHCLQFVITYKEKSTGEKKYVRVCMILDQQERIVAIMESKCVNASPKVNPSFTSAGGTVEVVEDSSANISREEWVNRFMQAWMSGDATTWDGLLHAEVGNLYLPGMSKTATGVPKSDAIELMQQSMPAFLAGGYDIVQVKGDDKCMTTATIIFKQPAPNGQKVKADIEINHIKDIHGFWVNMSYVEGNKKFTQADFVSAVEGSTPDTVAVEDQPIRDLPEDVRGPELLRRIIEAIKTNDAAAVSKAMMTNHINQLSMPKDNHKYRIAKPADVMADMRELIPNLDSASYSIYVTDAGDMSVEGVLSINDGKPTGEANYEFTVLYTTSHGVNGFILNSTMTTRMKKAEAGEPKIRVEGAAQEPGPAAAGAPAAAQSLCPADMDFSADSVVKSAESTQPKHAMLANVPAAQFKAMESHYSLILDTYRAQLAALYKHHRMNADARKDVGTQNFQAQLGIKSIISNPVTIIGNATPVSLDELNSKLDSPELAWGSQCSIYKVGYKGSALQVIYRLGAENADPLYINTMLLSKDLSSIYAVGESVLVNKEPQLAPGYKELQQDPHGMINNTLKR
ncbi:MAG: hypothetical protein IKV82_00260 [Akkermansia sp.]|nr:hypothetical protein [Akkermansia sp.]